MVPAAATLPNQPFIDLVEEHRFVIAVPLPADEQAHDSSRRVTMLVPDRCIPMTMMGEQRCTNGHSNLGFHTKGSVYVTL